MKILINFFLKILLTNKLLFRLIDFLNIIDAILLKTIDILVFGLGLYKLSASGLLPPSEHLGSFLKSICDQKAEHKCDALPALPADTAETADKGTILRNLVEIFEHVKD